jgi:hypothetical protein
MRPAKVTATTGWRGATTRGGLSALVVAIAAACPPGPPGNGLPSCEELACGGGSVCLDGACRPRACADLACDPDLVCQGGPLCLDTAEAEAPYCDTLTCREGTACQEGPQCRWAIEDLDGDGAASQVDCDDGNALRLPGNAEVCDGLDNDCDGTTDEEAPCLEGRTCCGEAGCVDPTANREHCGACGYGCDLYEECADNACLHAAPPEVSGVRPDPVPTGVWLGQDDVSPLVISGEHLLGYATVYIESDDGASAADPFEVVTSEGGRAYTNDQPIFIDGAQLPAGPATLRLVRNDGEESELLSIVVSGAAAPEITSVSPDPAPLGEEITLAAYGTGFWGEVELSIAAAQAEQVWMSLPVLWVTETWVRTDLVVLDPATLRAGDWLARVRNPDGAESEPYPFVVDPAPPPSLTSVSPTEAGSGTVVTLVLHGFDLFGTPTVLLAPEADPERVLPPLPVALVDSRRVTTEPVVLSPELYPAQPYLVWVQNPDEAASNRLRFVVLE